MEDRYLKLYKILSIVFSVIFIVFALLMMWEEIIEPEWKENQKSYQQVLIQKGTSSNLQQADFGIREIEIKDINHIDRCITCHVTVGQVTIDSLPLPFSEHPQEIINRHDLASFGCTLCHNGSGRALRREETCDRNNQPQWRPIESHCAHCHLAVFDSSSVYKSMPAISAGLKTFKNSGCLGCHKLRGIGGPFGPDLTSEGTKILKGYDFRYVEGNKSIINWQKEHLANPGRISPGSIMPKFSFLPSIQNYLITLLLGFSEPSLPLNYYDLNVVKEFKNQREKTNGKSAYMILCSACHGEKGERKDYKSNLFGVPGVANPDFQAVSSLDMISFMINEGRGYRYMPAWRGRHSGLMEDELLSLIKFVRLWRKEAPSLNGVANARYDINKGEELYLHYCSTCHRSDRSGGIGISLANASFASLATDTFLYLTLINGRSNTAMAAWSRFEASSLKSLIRFLQPVAVKLTNRPLVPNYNGDIDKGNLLFHYQCSRCHGSKGEGGIGPAILNRDFLEAAEDEFIIKTVKEGRSHTPMFKVEQSDSALSDLLAYMRSEKKKIPPYIISGPAIGNPNLGEQLFQQFCAECHGKNGEGTAAPQLNNQEFLNAATNGYLLATITLGRSGTPMPSWGLKDRKRAILTMRERHNIVSYIRKWQNISIRRQPNDPIYKILK
jgi:mono/diheme cytochrome c family protein